MIDHKNHIDLFQKELYSLQNNWDKILQRQAASLLEEKSLYVSKYVGYDSERGNVLVKFNKKVCIPPLRNEILSGFIPSVENQNFTKWGSLKYGQLYLENRFLAFETKSVFYKYDGDYIIVGFSGLAAEDVDKLKEDVLIYFGPPEEPIEYISNLLDFLKNIRPKASSLLNLEISEPIWNPDPLLIESDIALKLQTDLIANDIVIIQGPPGTGKTYLMAQICSAFLKLNYKILVTALTNRALIELAEKEHLIEALTNGKVFKTSLSADENKKIKGIKAFKNVNEQIPPLLLATYYKMSEIASQAMEASYFDYIIIEEASQAFLSTIAMAKKLGKKCIIIGDINQLEPIFDINFSKDDGKNFYWMVNGLKAISFFYPGAKQYILTDSYRLTANSVKTTNIFYKGKLNSKSNAVLPLNFSSFPILEEGLNKYGGTSLKTFNLSNGKKPSSECISYITDIINSLLKINKNTEIAVLSFHRESVKHLQTEVFAKCENNENVLIETIDRVQGLTVEYCLFFIPVEAFPRALEENRFNVATSRAKLCTLILTDLSIIPYTKLVSESVQKYLKSLNNDQIDPIQSHENPKLQGLTILGKIDLSKFEKPKKEIKNDKQNIYIIDTNVFVDFPEVISKIDKSYSIVLSAKEIDELDSLKIRLSEEKKKNVLSALKNINSSLDFRDICMETAEKGLLPLDFDTKSPDNLILSVALKFKDQNPIILTSDNGLQIKAKGLKITTISLSEFKKQLKW